MHADIQTKVQLATSFTQAYIFSYLYLIQVAVK